MKWKTGHSRHLAKLEAYKDWVPWFAWYPVHSADESNVLWLQWVERKAVYGLDEMGIWELWYYREAKQ